jgi:hypothetical protein
LVGFIAEVGREDVMNQTTGIESLHEIHNGNGIRVVNYATSENVTLKSTVFQYCKFHKFSWATDGNVRNQLTIFS